MLKFVRNQRGLAAAFELVAVALVILAVGFVAYRTYNARHQAKTPVAQAPAVDTAPNGKVDNAVNAITQDANDEANASAADDNETSQVNATSNSENNLGGSFDENSL